MIKLIPIGSTFKTHGVKGEIEVEIEEVFKPWLIKEKILFLYVQGNAIPFWISAIREDSRFFISLEEVDTLEEAKLLCNKTIYADENKIPASILKKAKADSLPDGLENYSMIDKTSGVHSKILSIQEFPSQWLAEVEVNDSKFLIPIHEDFISKIDQKNKILHLELPDGIFNLGE